MQVKVKNKVVRSRLTSIFPLDVFQQGTLYANKEIPSLKPAKRSPVETKVKAAQIPFKSETGIGESFVLEVITRIETDFPFWGQRNASGKHDGVIGNFVLAVIVVVGGHIGKARIPR